MKKQYVWIALFILATAITATLLINTSGLAQPTAQGQAMGQEARVILVAGKDNVEPMYLPPPDEFTRLRAQTANIQITWLYGTYGSTYCQTWPANAQTAFEYAVGIWESLINSPVPITVDACWENMGSTSGILGGAGPNAINANFSGAPIPGTWYPGALANALAGYDLSSGRSDISASFNSAFPNWDFTTGSSTSPTKYNFVSVVLHELCHGLGFISSLERYQATNSAWWGWSSPAYPVIMDRFIENGDGLNLVAKYPSADYTPSVALFNELTNNNVWFNGTNANAANGGGRPQLYAPSVWAEGSSISHLDYATYAGGVNTLMVYALNAGVTVHDPGPVTKGIFKDIGWAFEAPPTPTPTPTATPTPQVTVIPAASGGALTAIHETTTTAQFPPASLPYDIRVTLGFTDVTGYGVKYAPVKPGLLLSAVRVSDSQPVYELDSPFTLTIDYDNADVWSIKEDTLMVYYWNSGQWITATQTCNPATTFTRSTDLNRFTIGVCDMARYALMGETERIFLPIVLRNASP
ncbi:MAG: hypothetical protein JW934_16200 [Anaerolineae bacterium]|nr:hypothetical protein [Anaerolineae bacterium]